MQILQCAFWHLLLGLKVEKLAEVKNDKGFSICAVVGIHIRPLLVKWQM
jgi:hypothetical protein